MTHKEPIKEYDKLTQYPEGSARELFTIAFPLMLSVLSGNLMMFLDRLILANYSLEAMNAAATAGMACMVLQYGAIGIASITEVFVGQYNGARKYAQASQPAWQMIWFSLFTSIFFFSAAKWGGPYVLSDYHYESLALPYYQWLLYFSPIFAVQAAIAGFFIGLGKVRLVTIAAIIGNITNVFLDLILIFGVSSYIPSLGTKGAAIATGLSQCLQVLILLVPFFKKTYREKYLTSDFSFRPKLLWKCLRVGVPSSIGHMIEIAAWAISMRMMISVSEDHLTVMAIGQGFYAIIAFGMEGLQKAVTTITANFIGASKWHFVTQAWSSAVKLLLFFAAILSIPMIFYPDPMIHQFLAQESSPENVARLFSLLRIVSILVWSYFIFDGLTWISAGVLTAAGDTFFVMLINAISSWLFALTPVYIFVVLLNGSPLLGWGFVNFYGLMNALLFFIRFRQNKWKKKSVVISD